MQSEQVELSDGDQIESVKTAQLAQIGCSLISFKMIDGRVINTFMSEKNLPAFIAQLQRLIASP